MRVSTRYFDVLAAQDNVQAQQASLDAISRQLEQADKRFEVGLIAITDVQEARAARDTAAADLIAAKRQLATAQELLREITDMQYAGAGYAARHHAARRPGARRSAEVGRSVDGTEPRADLEPARRRDRARRRARAVRRSSAAGGPGRRQIALRERRHRDVRPHPGLASAAARAPSTQESDTDKSISLQVTVPIWSSGGTQSRVRQSSYRWQAAKQRLERVSRETERTSRDAYLGVVSEISRVQALKQALESSATALRATEAGYDVGTRTAVDVLAARQQLVGAQTDVLAQPLRLHAQRAAPQAVRRHPRPQGARRREQLAGDPAAAGESAAARRRRPRSIAQGSSGSGTA